MIELLKSWGVTSQMITSLVLTLILCIIAIVAGRRLQTVPGRFQAAIEIAIEKLRAFFVDLMGEYAGKKYFPIVATLFIYILLANYSGLLPMSGKAYGIAAPTSSINFPCALAVIVFFCVQIIGMKENHGIKYYKHLFQPVAFVFPLMLLEEFVRPFSLTLRLYGNIFGEESVVEELFEMVPILVPVIMQALSVLMGLIQALVFSLLAGIYIMEAAEHEGEELQA